MPYTECQPSREIFGRVSICAEHNRPVSDCVIASLHAEIRRLNAAFNNAMFKINDLTRER